MLWNAEGGRQILRQPVSLWTLRGRNGGIPIGTEDDKFPAEVGS